jgi:hypothetical protein
MMADRTRAAVLADVLDSLDQVWEQIATRRGQMTQHEYLWEPAGACWSVRRAGTAGTAGIVGIVDGAEGDEPETAPITTIAWREWHIAVDCLDSYSRRLFGRTGTGVEGATWVLDADESGRMLDRSWRNFRGGVADAGPDWLLEPLGDAWGPYAESSHLALVLHAQHEVAHHGAEIALLRDLHAARSR